MTLSNDLTASAFFTNPEILLTSFRSPDISFSSFNSPTIEFKIFGTSETRTVTTASGLTLLSIPRDTEIDGLVLKSILLVQLRQTREGVLAETWLEGVYEYGIGQDASESVSDLIISLGEYLVALEARQGQLGDSSIRELNALRKLLKCIA